MKTATQAEAASRRAANSTPLRMAARLGFVARGLVYILIGLLALEIAFGKNAQADRGGATALVAKHSFGGVLLWVLVVGFFGLALWRFSEAAFGAKAPDGHETSERLKSLGRGVLYLVFAWTTMQLAIGASSSATGNGNSQSRSETAKLMAHSGGRILVGVIGVVVVVAGVMLAREGWKKEFLQRMDLAGTSAGTRSAVEKLGVAGAIARGAVFAMAGIFVVVAAVRYQPAKATGLDGALREFAKTPLGPWLLVVVALGLVAFGLFSWCEARWRRV